MAALPGSVVLLLVASSSLFGQGSGAALPPPILSSVPDVRQIVLASIAATERHWQTRLRYTYLERDESRRRDLAGHLKSEDVDVSRTILVNGIPIEQLVERNGRPPSAEEQRQHKETVERLKRETPEQRA